MCSNGREGEEKKPILERSRMRSVQEWQRGEEKKPTLERSRLRSVQELQRG